MQFTAQAADLATYTADCFVIPCFEKQILTHTGKELDKLCHGHLSQVLAQGDFKAKVAETLLLYPQGKLKVSRILLVGLGKEDQVNERHYRHAVQAAIKVISASSIKQAVTSLTEVKVEKRDLAWKVKQTVLMTLETLYRFDHYKRDKAPAITLKKLSLSINDAQFLEEAKAALIEAEAIGKGVDLSKDLGNLPSNVCTPTYLAKEAQRLAKEHTKLKVTILEEADLKKLGMGAFLGVAQGSHEKAKLICLQYQGTAAKQKPICLVGKGITFDTGGISLKSGEGMVGMKYDMCGAATVFGVFKSVLAMKLPINLIGVMPCTENMPGGGAYKPEDILTSMSGITIEVLNTDAEGRLALSDALTYCEKFEPETVIDIATLTGAVVVALGHHATGLLANNDELATELLAAGNESYDRAWQLPLWEDYQEQIKSPFADIANTGGRAAGTITAACFLSRFTKKFNWAHLDVAGTAAMMDGRKERYATGRPVPLLTQFLVQRSKSHAKG